MFNVERANLIAARTVGSNRFMATVLQQNRGSAIGEETDMGDPTTMDGEDAESERPRLQQILQLENQLGTLHKFMRP